MKKLSVCLISVLILWISCSIPKQIRVIPAPDDVRVVFAQTPPQNAVLSEKTTIPSIDQMVLAISACENPKRDTKLKILDSNGLYSYSVMMFQKKTLTYYANRYGFRAGELSEEDMFNSSLQIETAKKMISENRGNLRHWYNCATRLGLL